MSAVPRALPYLVLVVLGCSPATIAPPSLDAGADAGSDASSASFTGACKAYAYARCTQLQSCSPTAILSSYGSVDTCEQYYTSSCEIAGAAPSTGSTVAHIDACTGEVANWKCSDLIYGENVPPDCQTLPGQLTDGSPCAVATQCQSTWCARARGNACGTCAPVPKPGDPCTLSIQCGSGLTCVQSIGMCAVHAPLGTQCGLAQPCDDGLNCVSSVCSAGESTPGATCDPAGAGCDFYAGLACDAASSTCQTVQLVSGGEACGTVGPQSQGCLAGQCTRGACVQGAALGHSCDLTSPLPCLSFAQCVVTIDGGTIGTCELPGETSCP